MNDDERAEAVRVLRNANWSKDSSTQLAILLELDRIANALDCMTAILHDSTNPEKPL